MDCRIEAGKYVKNRLGKNIKIYGYKNQSHTYWLFPIVRNNKKDLVKVLLKNGFDATFTSTQLKPIYSDLAYFKNPENCIKYLSKTVYPPVHEGIPRSGLKNMFEVINKFSTKD